MARGTYPSEGYEDAPEPCVHKVDGNGFYQNRCLKAANTCMTEDTMSATKREAALQGRNRHRPLQVDFEKVGSDPAQFEDIKSLALS